MFEDACLSQSFEKCLWFSPVLKYWATESSMKILTNSMRPSDILLVWLIRLAPQPGLPWSYLARPGQSNIRQFRWFVLMYWNSKELDGTDQYLVGSIWQSRPDRENFNKFWKCNEAVWYFAGLPYPAYPAYPVYCGLSHARNREIWSLKFQSQKSPT